MPETTLNIEVKHHALDQCQVFVNGFRVAYICYGEKKKLNYLPRDTAGIGLTIDEKIVVARTVRAKMAELSAARQSKEDELAALVAGDEPIDAGDAAEALQEFAEEALETSAAETIQGVGDE